MSTHKLGLLWALDHFYEECRVWVGSMPGFGPTEW
jgi:hypothetical protein